MTMLRRIAPPTAAAIVLLATGIAAAGLAVADPPVPQSGTPCSADLDGTLTWPTDATAPLACSDSRWEPVVDPYPISERWLGVGPPLTLHGQGRRNPNLLSGDWTGTPTDPETICRAVQSVAIPGLPEVGEPRTDAAPAGRPLAVRLELALVSVELDGDCLWQRTGG